MSFQVPEVQKRVVTEEKITVVTEREESPPPAGTPSRLHERNVSCLQASLVACLLQWACQFYVAHFLCLSENFKIKYYPLSARNTKEETSRRKKTCPSETGRSSTTKRYCLSLSPRTIFTILCSKANDDFVSSVICVDRECVSVFGVELQ